MFLQFIRKKDYFIGNEERALEEMCGKPKKPEREVAHKRLTGNRLRKMPAVSVQQAFYVIDYRTVIYMPPIKAGKVKTQAS